jgi:DMSO/TMAO reductase YedYZ molybdopterin-dependent catalytic subunit
MGVFSPGFRGRRRDEGPTLPPGQYLTRDFPVLSAGPTPRVPLDSWEFTVTTETATVHRWTWPELLALPGEDVTVDLHCVTKWSKFGTAWRGVPVDTLFADVETAADYVMVHSYGGYTTNLRWPTSSTGRPGSATPTTATSWNPRTADRPGCSYRTCTCGSRPSGYAASSA